MQQSNASPSNSTTLGSTLRPRTRRPRSDLDDRSLIDLSPARSSQPSSAHASPSRSSGAQYNASDRTYTTFSGAWTNSVSTIQGLASSVLGSDTSNSITSSWKRKRPVRNSSPRTIADSPPVEWGPLGLQHTHIGAGSKGEHMARVMEAKRRVLLNANGHTMPDSTGRFKRRTSDDLDPNSLPCPEDADTDALIYIHIVRPGDTLAGLTIKYNCQAALLRKANRMWPNDPIQSRKIVMVPVDGCSVKGKKVPGHEAQTPEVDLLGDETIIMHESPSLPTNGWGRDLKTSSVSNQPKPSPESSPQDSDPPWKHDSWVLLPNDTQPTEIVRLPRQSLGYFPRARRKSNTFSDLDTSRTTSFDLSRQTPSSPSLNPHRSPQSPSRASPSRSSARPSLSATRARASSNALASVLHGPGGVGSLSKSTSLPGPGPERLSEFFAPNGPSFVSPPQHLTVFTPWTPSLLADANDPAASGGADFAAANNAAGTGAGLDIQDVGGAIEGWVRRVARRAASAIESNASAAAAAAASSSSSSSMMGARGKGNAGVQSLGVMGGGGMGDLIELVDAFEIGDDSSGRNNDSQSVSVDTQMPTTNIKGASVSAWDNSKGGLGEMRGRKQMRNEPARTIM